MPDNAAKKRARYRADPTKALEANRRWRQNNPEKAKACARRMQYEQPARWIIGRVPVTAKRRGIECTITHQELERILAPMVCAVTGLPLSFSPYDGDSGTRHPWKPSFDRIDNAKGYVPGNVQLVCWAYNLAKASWGHDVPLMWAKALIEKHSEKSE
jgi:hypothetical protein